MGDLKVIVACAGWLSARDEGGVGGNKKRAVHRLNVCSTHARARIAG